MRGRLGCKAGGMIRGGQDARPTIGLEHSRLKVLSGGLGCVFEQLCFRIMFLLETNKWIEIASRCGF
jgi:hypothetical protein